jgi:DNA polymerase I-like protein with 3'-5' exonuclease and polymerase domains
MFGEVGWHYLVCKWRESLNPKNIIEQGTELYEGDNYVTLDFETDTSHGDYGHAVHKANGLVLASWKVGPSGRVVSHFGDEFDQEMLLKDIEDADFIICHNAKYELGWLKRCGLDLREVRVYDTKIAEYVLLGNLAAGCDKTGLPPRSTSLDQCCRRRGWKIKDPVVDKMMHYGINPIYIPRPWLQGRCEQDVSTTHDLFQDQMELLRKTNRVGVVLTRCLLTPALAAMEFEGMCLDKDRVDEVYKETRDRYNILSREMDEFTDGINWRSPIQVAEFLYDKLGFDELRGRDGKPQRTSSERRKTDKNTMSALKATTPEQKKFVGLRGELGKVNAALSKSLEFFQGVCAEYGCIFHAVFNQTVTSTHRLSSSGHKTWFELFEDWKTVQFQNMARIFKRLFKSREDGWLMMEVDGSQLEFRVAADIAHDEQAMQDILDPDFDAHCTSAAAMHGIDYAEFLREYRAGSKQHKVMRTAAKVDTFKPLYGGESGTKKQKRWYKYFKERYHGVAEAQERWVEEVLETKRLITPWGMRYYWPRAKRGRDGYVNVKANVYNYPVQAFATAEIIPIAVSMLWYRLRDNPLCRMVNTVHDSVILEVHPDAIDSVRTEAIQAFGVDTYEYLKEIYGYQFEVPLGCGVTVGTHWSEGDEESYNVWPDGNVERIT